MQLCHDTLILQEEVRHHKGDTQQEDRTVDLKFMRSQGYMHSFGVVYIAFKAMKMHESFKRRQE